MLGILIKQERLTKGLSQAQLCKNICTASYLSKIENENAICDDEIYDRLFEALNINFIDDENLLNIFDELLKKTVHRIE